MGGEDGGYPTVIYLKDKTGQKSGKRVQYGYFLYLPFFVKPQFLDLYKRRTFRLISGKLHYLFVRLGLQSTQVSQEGLTLF